MMFNIKSNSAENPLFMRHYVFQNWKKVLQTLANVCETQQFNI